MVDRIIKILGLGEEDLRRRLSYLDLSEEDLSFLREALELLPEEELASVFDRFYDHLFKFERAREILSGVDSLERLKKAQSGYLREMFEGKHDLNYLRSRIALGLRHEKAEVDPGLFTGAYAKWVDLILTRIGKRLPPDKAFRTALAVFKAVILDITLTLEAYNFARVIRSGEPRYKAVIDSVPEGVAVVDMRSERIVDVNRVLADLLGADVLDLIGERVEVLFPEEKRESLWRELRSLLPEGGRSGEVVHLLNRATGEWIPSEAYIGTFTSEGMTFSVLVFRDIRERIRREAQLERIRKLYDALVSINTLITTAGGVDTLISSAVRIVKVKGDFKYAGVFPKEDGEPIAEYGEYSDGDVAVCLSFDGYVLVVSRYGQEAFTQEEVTLLAEIAQDLSFSLRRISSERKARHLEIHDSLTGLINRRFFIRRLKEITEVARARDTRLALIVVDVDNFNEINQAFGYRTGDEVLRDVARRVRSVVRGDDLVGRIGGDEFGILITAEDGKTAVERLISRLRDEMTEPVRVDSRDIFITFSCGVSFFPEDASDHETLIANAMASVRRAKDLGGNRTVYFSEGVDRVTEERVNLRADLRRAIDRGEFRLYYQPKVNLRTGKVEGCEALLRWVRDQKVIPPSRFLRLLEESELIHRVGEWVVGEVCRQMGEWKKKGIEIRIALNVSPLQLRTPSFADSFVGAVLSCGGSFDRLEVEITESAVMENVAVSVEFLNTLASYGVRTYIDDFGTGYSSLFYLKKLPVYALKIDREFIKDLPDNRDDLEIVKAIILLARTFGLKTVAEGTETEEQVRVLRDLGCDYAQGFYFSPPLPPEDFERYLKENG
ncbi:MAG: EAL domain-containing protein [Aquificota bacterium]|nr:EAL domain-containing protein [Aquificota bacterium]